jgi:hypothetical protein
MPCFSFRWRNYPAQRYIGCGILRIVYRLNEIRTFSRAVMTLERVPGALDVILLAYSDREMLRSTTADGDARQLALVLRDALLFDPLAKGQPFG